MQFKILLRMKLPNQKSKELNFWLRVLNFWLLIWVHPTCTYVVLPLIVLIILFCLEVSYCLGKGWFCFVCCFFLSCLEWKGGLENFCVWITPLYPLRYKVTKWRGGPLDKTHKLRFLQHVWHDETVSNRSTPGGVLFCDSALFFSCICMLWIVGAGET